jgi:hypothetical protein
MKWSTPPLWAKNNLRGGRLWSGYFSFKMEIDQDLGAVAPNKKMVNKKLASGGGGGVKQLKIGAPGT